VENGRILGNRAPGSLQPTSERGSQQYVPTCMWCSDDVVGSAAHSASRRTPGGLTRVLSAASWLARLVARLVPVRGLTQQRRDDEALAKGYLEVGLSAAEPLPDPTERTRLR
jgi:hypothetical protein